MSALPNYSVDVPGVGAFVFRRRTFRDQAFIEAESRRILGGDSDSPVLRRAAAAIATLTKLTAECPEGWDVEAVDPMDEDQVDDVLKVFGALRAAEDDFRNTAKSKRP